MVIVTLYLFQTPRKFEYFIWYITFKNSEVSIILSAFLPASLPAYHKTCSAGTLAPVFHTTKVIAIYLQNCCIKEGLSTVPWSFF